MSNDWQIISTYSTKEAVADGVLVKIPQETSKEAGIKFPVYFSRNVWDRYVEVPDVLRHEQDLQGRLWDILWLFAWKARRTSDSLLFFHLQVVFPDNATWDPNEKGISYLKGSRDVRLKAVIQAHDFDDPSAAIFIMQSHED